MQTEYSLFDVQAYLESRGIDYHSAGEDNVSRGWVNITCPFPECDDHSWHCGVNLESKLFSCYLCGNKGPIPRLIRQIEGCSFAQANSVLESFQNPSNYPPNRELGRLSPRTPTKSLIPREAGPLQAIHRDYLINRNFDPERLETKYRLMGTGNLGRYKFRIVIPVVLDGRVVSFTSRDVTGKARSKYKDQPPEESVVPVKRCLYNLDSVGDAVVVVEGPTDVWRIGDGCVATMTTQWNDDQVALLRGKGLKRAFVMFDSDARHKMKRLADRLSMFVPDVETIGMDEGDPGDWSEERSREFRREIGL